MALWLQFSANLSSRDPQFYIRVWIMGTEKEISRSEEQTDKKEFKTNKMNQGVKPKPQEQPSSSVSAAPTQPSTSPHPA